MGSWRPSCGAHGQCLARLLLAMPLTVPATGLNMATLYVTCIIWPIPSKTWFGETLGNLKLCLLLWEAAAGSNKIFMNFVLLAQICNTSTRAIIKFIFNQKCEGEFALFSWFVLLRNKRIFFSSILAKLFTIKSFIIPLYSLQQNFVVTKSIVNIISVVT